MSEQELPPWLKEQISRLQQLQQKGSAPSKYRPATWTVQTRNRYALKKENKATCTNNIIYN